MSFTWRERYPPRSYLRVRSASDFLPPSSLGTFLQMPSVDPFSLGMFMVKMLTKIAAGWKEENERIPASLGQNNKATACKQPTLSWDDHSQRCLLLSLPYCSRLYWFCFWGHVPLCYWPINWSIDLTLWGHWSFNFVVWACDRPRLLAFMSSFELLSKAWHIPTCPLSTRPLQVFTKEMITHVATCLRW